VRVCTNEASHFRLDNHNNFPYLSVGLL